MAGTARAGTFPFGEPIVDVVQRDRDPKRLFVLGIYASAVHARWLAEDGSTLVNALAVASEPECFWRGDGAEQIVGRIPVPPCAGSLVPADHILNGPSGHALDEHVIAPLGLTRDEAWLCDLVPHSCRNDKQAAALRRTYDSRAEELGLPAWEWPPVPDVLADTERVEQILAEVREASPDVIVTLGDAPLRWFASRFGAKGKLAAYGETRDSYGRFREVRIDGRETILLPLAHPRQVAKLGSYSAKLGALHDHWERCVADDLLL